MTLLKDLLSLKSVDEGVKPTLRKPIFLQPIKSANSEDGEIRKGDKVTITYKKHPNAGESGVVVKVDDTGEELTVKLANGKTVKVGCDDVDVEGLNESSKYTAITVDDATDEDYTMVEVIDDRGEDFGHYSVIIYKNGKVEVFAAEDEPNKQQEKEIIAVAKAALDQDDLKDNMAPKGEIDESNVNEATQPSYTDSAEFMKDVNELERLVKRIGELIKSKKWNDYVTATDSNFDTDLGSQQLRLIRDYNKLLSSVSTFMEELLKAE